MTDILGTGSAKILKFETGEMVLDTNQLAIVCRRLKVTPNFLFGISSYAELDNVIDDGLVFDPKNKEHIKAYRYLMKYNKWPQNLDFGFSQIGDINAAIIREFVVAGLLDEISQ